MKKKKIYTSIMLVDEKGGQYSANPSDYFRMKDTDRFKGLYLAGTEQKKGRWSRLVMIKRNPSKKDLKEVI